MWWFHIILFEANAIGFSTLFPSLSLFHIIHLIAIGLNIAANQLNETHSSKGFKLQLAWRGANEWKEMLIFFGILYKSPNLNEIDCSNRTCSKQFRTNMDPNCVCAKHVIQMGVRAATFDSDGIPVDGRVRENAKLHLNMITNR